MSLFFAASSIMGAERFSLAADPARLRKNIQQKLSANSTVAQAQELMASNGFKCHVNTNGMFAEQIRIGQFVNHTNVSYLYCSRVRRSWGVRQTKYVVGLPYGDLSAVTNVWVQVWEEGLLP
jgi:hypothetical protein